MLGIQFVSFSDKKYLEQKYATSLKARQSKHSDESATINYLASRTSARPIDFCYADAQKERANISDSSVSEIDKISENAIQMINKQYPLVSDENVIEDYFSYLTADYKDYTAGTPLLIRKTNKATMVHFFNCSCYKNGGIEFLANNPNEQGSTTPPALEVFVIDDIISSLFLGMVSGIGEKIGAKIFETAFPNDSDNIKVMLQNLQDNITKIFRQELDQQTIDNLNYRISGVISYMQETYLPQKQAGRDKQYLESILSAQNSTMYTDVMALLMGERYRAKGIAYLVVGATTHLSLIQEMALVDPTCDDPNKSAYMQTYYLRLGDYISSLNTAIIEVYNNRLTYLGDVQESTLQGAATDHWWFIDSWANYHSPDFYNTKHGTDYYNDAKKKAVNARNDYYNNTFHPTIATDLQPYNDTVSKWQNFEHNKPN